MSKLKQTTQRHDSAFQDGTGSAYHVLAGLLLIFGLVLFAYWPSMQGGFIMDDDILLTDSALIKAPDGLYRIWFTKEPSDYWPVSNSFLWLQWRLWGMNPTGYHVVNVLLHTANCLLIWLLLNRLAISGSFFAALLFAIHPVNVESVAWIAQLKTILSMFFFLISIICYVNVRRSFNRWYWFSIIAFVFAMLSKGSVAILPLILLLVIWWQNRRLTARDAWQIVPFLLVAIGLSGINFWVQTHGAQITVRTATDAQRLTGAGAALWFYLFKAILPINLLFAYPQWNIDPTSLLWWLPTAVAVAVTVVLCRLGLFGKKPWARNLLFAWLYFGLALLPALGFIDVGYMKYSLVADHYQYLALLGPVSLVAGSLAFLRNRSQQLTNFAVYVGSATLTVILLYLTWQQNHLYANSLTLYEATERQNPTSWLMQTNLSIDLVAIDRVPEALDHAQQAARLNPDYPVARLALGYALAKMGRTDQAIEQYRQALELDPNSAVAASSLGTALASKGQVVEALPYLERAVTLNPACFEARSVFGRVLATAGRLPEALEQLTIAVQLHPDYSEGEIIMGCIEQDMKHNSEALSHFQQALKVNPNLTEAHFRSAQVCADMNQPAEALAAAQKAIDMARAQKDFDLATQCQAWLTNYRSQQVNRP